MNTTKILTVKALKKMLAALEYQDGGGDESLLEVCVTKEYRCGRIVSTAGVTGISIKRMAMSDPPYDCVILSLTN